MKPLRLAAEKMGPDVLVEEKKIEETIGNISSKAFTVLDFMQAFKTAYPKDWERLVRKYGLFGGKRRYTVSTYLSNRLDIYSQKPHSILAPFTRYREAEFTDYRRTTVEEKKVFGGQWIAVFRKK